MRKTFCGFYSLNDKKVIKEIWNSDKTIFVFDTNCLLNLYRCEDTTRDDILDVMSKISEKIWLPFFVCLEYQKNRRTVITDSISNLNLIKNSLNEVVNSVTKSLSTGNVKKHLYNALSESVHSLQKDIKPLIDEFIASNIDTRIDSKEKINKRDIIRDRIDVLVNDKCGSPPTAEWINDVNNKGAERYKKLIPPGFMDASKAGKKYFFDLEFEEKYGDLYIWMEIIEKSKKNDIESVIFVCDDRKKDWWYETKGITHGALESLQTEIYTKSGIKNFKLMTQATFLHNAQDCLPNIKINSESLKEVQQISDSQNDLRKIVINTTLKRAFYNSQNDAAKESLDDLFTEKTRKNYEVDKSSIFDDITANYPDKDFIPLDTLIKYQNLIEENIDALRYTYGALINCENERLEKLHEYTEEVIRVDTRLTIFKNEISKCIANKDNLIDDYIFVRSSLLSKIDDALHDCSKLLTHIEMYILD